MSMSSSPSDASGSAEEKSKSDLGFWLTVAALVFVGYHLWKQQAPAMKKGMQAPALETVRILDNLRSQESWKGKITILHFWATW